VTREAAHRLEAGVDRTETVRRLRGILPGILPHPGSLVEGPSPLSFGSPELDGRLPGLRLELLHEIAPARPADGPTALGFALGLTVRALQDNRGAALIVASRRAMAELGRPYGPGLNGLGLDPGRLVLVEAGTPLQVLWALEEALRARSLRAVLGLLGGGLALKPSRRLALAAAGSGSLLLCLRPAGAEEANAAAFRWRVSARPAERDAFGALGAWRCGVALERCRQGRPGEFALEWDHESLRFCLAAGMADHAAPLADEFVPELLPEPLPLRRAARS
jgi:protein ImuA